VVEGSTVTITSAGLVTVTGTQIKLNS
jgi:hypothetical protein